MLSPNLQFKTCSTYSLPISSDAIPPSNYSGHNLGLIFVSSLPPTSHSVWQEIMLALPSKYIQNPITSGFTFKIYPESNHFSPPPLSAPGTNHLHPAPGRLGLLKGSLFHSCYTLFHDQETDCCPDTRWRQQAVGTGFNVLISYNKCEFLAILLTYISSENLCLGRVLI